MTSPPHASSPPAAALPAVQVSRRGAARICGGHPWVYRSDVSARGVPPGALVQVVEPRGRALGSALYSSASQFALRMVSSQPLADDASLLALVRQRVRDAAAYRRRLVEGSDAYRVIFSEADFLPGLVVDKYADLLSMQVLTQAMDRDDLRACVLETLRQELAPVAIVERMDPRIRELEHLPPRPTRAVFGAKTETEFSLNGIKFLFDGFAGQKTGAFLDQRENYSAAARYAHGEALDVFCYQGGFALHFAPLCSSVTGVDLSRAALEIAEHNAALNRREIEWLEANAFDLLRDYADAGRRYDTIVLDPPAFAKDRRALAGALRGYKELNLRALKMLRPGGVLVTCSCSFHVSSAEFLEMLSSAAADAHRSPRVLEVRGQSRDHPAVLNIAETTYLKCVILSV